MRLCVKVYRGTRNRSGMEIGAEGGTLRVRSRESVPNLGLTTLTSDWQLVISDFCSEVPRPSSSPDSESPDRCAGCWRDSGATYSERADEIQRAPLLTGASD